MSFDGLIKFINIQSYEGCVMITLLFDPSSSL